MKRCRDEEVDANVNSSKDLSSKDLGSKDLGSKDLCSKEQLESALGKVFLCTNCYGPPNVYQLIGWNKKTNNGTAKRQIAIVRTVKFHTEHNGIHGGSGVIDVNDIVPVVQPVLNGGDKTMTLYKREKSEFEYGYEEEREECALKERRDGLVSEYYIEHKLDRVFQWCDY